MGVLVGVRVGAGGCVGVSVEVGGIGVYVGVGSGSEQPKEMINRTRQPNVN